MKTTTAEENKSDVSSRHLKNGGKPAHEPLAATATVDISPSAIPIEIPLFPWCRFETGLFVWEEALIEGDYVHMHHSGMGRFSSRDKVWEKWQNANKPFGYNRNHLQAFELEVDGQRMQGRWALEGERREINARGGLEHTLILKDSLYPVRVSVKTLLDGTSFMERWLEIENTGDKPFRISRLSPWCGVFFQEADASFSWKSVSRPLEHEVQLARYFNSSWCEEGDFRWINLSEGTYRHESTTLRRHSPNHYWLRDVTTGACAVIDFEYTGGVSIDFTRVTRPRPFEYVRARAGMDGTSPLRVVAPGETVISPRTHFSLLYGNEDTTTNAFFDHVRKSVIPPRHPARTYPLEYQSCSYLIPKMPPVTADFLRQEVEIAATLGAEAIIVDAGWNVPKGKTYAEAFGDWEEHELLEGKLSECFDYARQRGLQAALWVPIEGLALTSKTFREKAHWTLLDKGKNIEMLDLTRREVADYVYDKICHLVDKYSLDIFRIDGSTPEYLCWLGENGESIEDLTWRYYDSLYDIFDRIRLRYPNLILENCWGGGGRIDLAMMRRFDWAQISDNWHPEEQLRCFNGISLSIPPEQCVLWVGAINMHEADIDFVIRAGLLGNFCIAGVAPSPGTLTEPGLSRWKHAVDIFKRHIRPILTGSRLYHHTLSQNMQTLGDWVVLEMVSEDRRSAVVALFRLQSAESPDYVFKPRGLDPSLKYKVTLDNENRTVSRDGMELRSAGIPITIPGTMQSELLIIQAE